MNIFKKIVEKISDEKLMSRVTNGDQSAYAELVNRHMKPVFRLSYSLLRDTGKAEDITQDTFFTLWESADKWKPSGQLKSWLFRIARNKSIDEIRRRKDHVDIDKTAIKDEQKSPYNHVIDHQLTSIINDHLKELPGRQREAITLVHFLECTNIEAAEAMEISIEALESLLSRGRKKLKALLGNYEDILFKRRA